MLSAKFCPQCGKKLESTLKFCHNCGFNLAAVSSGRKKASKTEKSEKTSGPDNESQDSYYENDVPESPGDDEGPAAEEAEEADEADEGDEGDESDEGEGRKAGSPKGGSPKIDLHVTGKNLGTILEKIYKAEGYLTQKHQKISSSSGYYHEVDIIAVKDNDKIAIECKNYLSPVGVEKVRDFSEKVRDLGTQWRGVFASHIAYTKDAAACAQDLHIELLTLDDIRERLYTALSGQAALQGDKVYIEDALPVHVGYAGATKLTLKNSDKITVNRARLVFHPYMLFSYEIKKAWYDKKAEKSQVYKRDGVIIVDLLDNDVIVHDARKEHEIINHKPRKSLAVGIDQDYQVIRLEPNYNKRASVNIAKTYTLEKYAKGEKLPFALKKSDIIVDAGRPVYVPKWDILFDAFGKIYQREVFACSGEVLFDTLAHCPRHRKILGSKILVRNTIAVCEECGEAFCPAHGTRCSQCNKWLCTNHTITCSICKKPFCTDHARQGCDYCKEYVCSRCLVTCPTCGHTVGRNHLLVCDRCGKQNCERCMTTTGTVFLKQYCKGTCDVAAQAEQEKEGLLTTLKKKMKKT